eukprot:SAG31_NODE_844_length_11549_cov_2.985852_2_plen_190_part_00
MEYGDHHKSLYFLVPASKEQMRNSFGTLKLPAQLTAQRVPTFFATIDLQRIVQKIAHFSRQLYVAELDPMAVLDAGSDACRRPLWIQKLLAAQNLVAVFEAELAVLRHDSFWEDPSTFLSEPSQRASRALSSLLLVHICLQPSKLGCSKQSAEHGYGAQQMLPAFWVPRIRQLLTNVHYGTMQQSAPPR